jgi:hypothetical protein
MTSGAMNGKRFDLAHLVATLLSLREPSRGVDRLIDAMLAGSSVLHSIAPMEIKFSNWMSEDAIPAYTAGGRAVLILAHRLGMRIECEDAEFGCVAIASDPEADVLMRVPGTIHAATACAALAAVAAARGVQPTMRPRR